MIPRKIPMRKCTGCGELKPKKELIRVIVTPDESARKTAGAHTSALRPDA